MKASSKLLRLSLVAGWLVVMAIAFGPQAAYAATCVSQGNGAWETAGNWNCGHVPITGDSAQIANGYTITIGTGSENAWYVDNVTVDNGGILILARGIRVTSSTFAVNGTLQINSGGFVELGTRPTYSSASTLKYNTNYNLTINEWDQNVSSGAGVPYNVEIVSGKSVSYNGAFFPRTALGNVAVDGTLTLGGANSGNFGDLKIGGNLTRGSSGTLTTNSRAIWFNGSSDQTIAVTGGGTLSVEYLIVDKSGGNLKLSSSPATDVTITASSADPLQIINSGGIDLNGRTLTLSSSGGNLKVSGATRNITGSGTVAFTGNKTVTSASSGALAFGTNVVVKVGATVDFGSSLSTINGTLQIEAGGSVTTNPPTYGAASLLKYNSGGSYSVGNEWGTGTTVGAGVPQNVQVSTSGTNVSLTGGSARTVPGNVTIDSGTTLALSATSGGDLNVKGNWTNNGTFTHNSRTVTFNGGGTSTYGGSSTTTFNNLTVNAGTTLDVGTNTLFGANGTVTNNGTLKQTQTVNANATVTFLNVSTTKYYGVEIVAGGTALGSTTVYVSGNRPDTSTCPDIASGSRPVRRCYLIDVTNSGSASATFYYTRDELRADLGQSAANLKVWRNTSGTTWAQLASTPNATCASGQLNCSVQATSFTPTRIEGAASPDDTTDDYVLMENNPQAVTLADFSAAQTGDAVLLTWETNSELNNRGFNLYRGVDPSAPDRQLNDALIPSQSQGNPGGFIYTWEDRADLVPGTTYYYWVEDVDLNNVATRHGPVSVDYSVPTAVRVLDAGATASLPLALPLVGAGLLALVGLAARRRRS